MSKKSAKIAELVAGLDGGVFDARYLGYFACFNQQLFFEAHDVLEELWLAQGKAGADHAFHKGLIQLAGAFVHLQKQRMRPAVALFDLADANLRRYPAAHAGLDLAEMLALIAEWRARIVDQGFEVNPLRPETAPVLALPAV